MNLIREIFFSPMVVDAAGIILIVAALPMVGWSWAVSHMAGPKDIWRSCAMAGVSGAKAVGTAAKREDS